MKSSIILYNGELSDIISSNSAGKSLSASSAVPDEGLLSP